MLNELLIDHLVRAGDIAVGLFNLHDIHIIGSLAAEGERNHLAVQTQQAAAQVQVIEIVKRLHNRTGFALKIALECAAVQVAPVNVKREGVLDVVLCHVLVGPAALIGCLEAVDEVSLALELFAGERCELFREIDIIVAVLALVREREFSGAHSLNAFDHRLGNGNDDKRDTTFCGVLLECVKRRAEVALPHGSKVAIVSATQRRHLNQHEAVPEADFRVVVTAPHEEIDKAALAQMIVVMGTAEFDCGLVL